ncbi:MAG: SCP2 sterol-binding domain-containing protein [Egibacteraceae bacterium]
MPVFPSGEWMEAFCAALASRPGVERVAESLAGTYRFVVQQSGPLREGHAYDVSIAKGANGTPAVSWSAGDSVTPTIELVADYERWRQIISGTMDVPLAVMLGRLRVRGDIARVTNHAADARPLLDALKAVPTTWL